jgi:hypothetical protein
MGMTLTPRIEDQIRQWIDSGDPDARALLSDAMRPRHERKLETLRANVKVGLDQLDRGEGIELTAAPWDEIDREADKRVRRGELPDSNVCP